MASMVISDFPKTDPKSVIRGRNGITLHLIVMHHSMKCDHDIETTKDTAYHATIIPSIIPP